MYQKQIKRLKTQLDQVQQDNEKQSEKIKNNHTVVMKYSKDEFDSHKQAEVE